MLNWIKNIRDNKRWLLIPFFLIVLTMMGFVAKKQSEKTVKNIFIHVDQEHDNYFVGKEEVLDLLTMNGSDLIIGQYVDKISLKELEVRVKSHNFVESAQVFKDPKGNLTIKVNQCRPIARIIDAKGPNAYIGSNGECLPSSEKFTARVLLVDGSFAHKLKNDDFLSSEEGLPYFELIQFIHSDQLWRAQIAQLTVLSNGEVLMHTQIGDQIIDFGKPVDIEKKFRKLKIFYKKIYPFKGYNQYSKVVLKFDNQIVCE
jgi:cell division protein FtsQ